MNQSTLNIGEYPKNSKFNYVRDLIKDIDIGKFLICTPNISATSLRKHLSIIGKEDKFIVSEINKNNTYKIKRIRRLKYNLNDIKFRIGIPRVKYHGYSFDIKELERIRNEEIRKS